MSTKRLIHLNLGTAGGYLRKCRFCVHCKQLIRNAGALFQIPVLREDSRKEKARKQAKPHTKTSDMEDQFQVLAALGSNPFPCYLFLSRDVDEFGVRKDRFCSAHVSSGFLSIRSPPVRDLAGNSRNTRLLIEARIDGTWNFSPNYSIWFLIFSRVGGGEINPCEIKFGFDISISIRFCAD